MPRPAGHRLTDAERDVLHAYALCYHAPEKAPGRASRGVEGFAVHVVGCGETTLTDHLGAKRTGVSDANLRRILAHLMRHAPVTLGVLEVVASRKIRLFIKVLREAEQARGLSRAGADRDGYAPGTARPGIPV